jgi:NADH-ubiquinone oxidoreductase chain 1
MESELVSGFMTEHAAVIFVFFFLAEYASIVLICILTTVLFLGGYLYNLLPFSGFIFNIIQYINFDLYLEHIVSGSSIISNPIVEGLFYSLSLGLKTCIMVFIFI